MKNYTSISDFLEAHGYVAEGEGYVNRTTKLPAVRLEYADWKDLPVDAFIEKAKAQRWVSPYSDEEGLRIKEAWRKEHPMPLFMDEGMEPTTKAIAEGLLEDEIVGTPRLESVMNLLKVSGGGAEW